MNSNQVSPFSRFCLLLVLSIGMIIIDHRSTLLNPVRAVTTIINVPFEFLIQIPKNVSSTLRSYYPDNSLYEKFIELQQNQAVLQSRLQRYEALEKENQRLTKLLAASKHSSDEVLLSEIVNVGLEPFQHKIIVSRGIEDGVYLGQPAIAPEGVVGQVSEIGYKRSVITLISDPSHGIPVQIQRNGLRTIVQGTGKADLLTVPFLASQSDIQQGDILVTSGMGGRFPVGYKVAEIIDIVSDANEAFLTVTAKTTARISFTKEVLLLWNTNQNNAFESPHPGNSDD